jgi:hypothetical protein
MTDQDIRSLWRLAESRCDAASWSRLAHALIRVERFEDAGHALVRARAVGEADPAMEDALESLRVASFAARSIASTDVGIESLAWTPDGRRLLLATAQHSLLALEVATGTLAPVARLDGPIGAMATSLDSSFAWVCWLDGLTVQGVARLARVDLTSAACESVAVLTNHRPDQVAGWLAGARAVVVTGYDTATVVGDGPPRVVAEIAGHSNQVVLGWNGSAFAVSQEDVEVYPALEDVPARSLTLDPDASWGHGHLLALTRPTLHGARLEGRLAFATERGARSFIERLSILGKLHGVSGDLYSAGPDPERPQALHVSPGGRYAAWLGLDRLELVDLLAGERKVLTALASDADSVPAISWSPCGRKLAFARGGSLWIAQGA